MDKLRRGLEKARSGLTAVRYLSSTCATFAQNNSLPTDLKRFLEEVRGVKFALGIELIISLLNY
jgi:hypothetical protein